MKIKGIYFLTRNGDLIASTAEAPVAPPAIGVIGSWEVTDAKSAAAMLEGIEKARPKCGLSPMALVTVCSVMEWRNGQKNEDKKD